MFEHCTILNECEEIIIQNLNGVNFLGQIELSPNDVNKLGTFIKNKISDAPTFGMEQIEKHTPACLCLYLVWKGILNYNNDKADYWTAVSNDLGDIDANLQTRMGRIFIDFINNKNLENIELRDSYQYVTPILFHGGIPQNCLHEYFYKVILPMVKTWKADKEKIKDYLYTVRTHENKRRIIRKEISDIRNKINNYSRIIIALRQKEDQYQKYFALLEHKRNVKFQINDINSQKEDFKEKYLFERNLSIDKCIENIHECIEQYEILKDTDIKTKQARQKADASSNSLERQCSGILNSKWNTEIIENIVRVEPDTLAVKLEAYHTMIAKNATHINTPLFKPIELIVEVAIIIFMLLLPVPNKTIIIAALFMFICLANVILMKKRNRKKKQAEEETSTLRKDILQYLTGIPIKEDILSSRDVDIPGIINQLRDTYTEYRESHKAYEGYLQYKNTIEQVAAALLHDTFSTKDTAIEETLFNDYDAMVQNAVDILCRYKQLENKMNQELNKLYQCEKKIDVDIQQMCEELFGNNENTSVKEELLDNTANRFGYDDHIERMNQTIRELKARVQLKENELTCYSQSIRIVNQTIYRFIIFGGNWAEMIITESVELMANTMNGAPISGICNLPARITKAFYDWYALYINNGTTIEKPKDRSKQRITSPDIVYDNDVGGVKIVMGSQLLVERAYIDFDIYLEIEYSNPLIEKQHAPLYAVVSDGVIRTEPCELFLNDLFGKVSVTLSVGDENYTWNYILLTDKSPYLAFSEKGQLIHSEGISGKLVWLVLSKNYGLSDKSLIIEESVSGGNAENTSIYLIDIYGEENLKLLGSDGEELLLGISNSSFFDPYIEGGEITDGITFAGEIIYREKPEYLVIPYEEENLEYWSITISYCDDFTEREHFNITDLSEVEKCEGKAKISLPKSKILKENQQGRCTLYLYYRKRKPFVFEINIIHDFYLSQKPGFLAMPLDPDSTVGFELSLPENAHIDYITPVHVEEKVNNIYKLSTKPGNGFVEGRFRMDLSDGSSFEAPITIELSIVRWRINGLPEYEGWSCCCEELWLGKWNNSDKLNLELYVPSDLFRYIKLYIGHYGHVKTLDIKNRIASANIKGFYDSLKSGDSLKKMCVDFFNTENKRMRTGYLFSIQCKWEIVNFKYTVDDIDDRRKLTFFWNEKGVGENRAIRIWRTWEPYSKPVTNHIPDGEFTFSMEKDRLIIPDGEYLLQFTTIDPWEDEEPADFIPKDSMNTFSFTLSDGTPHVKGWKAVWKGDNQVNISGGIANAAAEHRVTVAIYGICHGQKHCFISRGLSKKDGNFNICVRNNTAGIMLKNVAHWIGIFLDRDHDVYEYYLLSESACLEWRFQDFSAKSLLNWANDFDIIMKIDDSYMDSYTLNTQTGRRMIEGIINQKNTQFSVRISGQSKAQLVYEPDCDEVYLKVEKGVKCCSCGKILSSQSEWFTHAHITHCKGLNTNYSKVAITLYIVWRSRVKNEYLNRNVLLFSSRCNPIPEEHKINLENSEQIIKLLWEREKAFI